MRARQQTFNRARRLRREMTLPELVLWQARPLRRAALATSPATRGRNRRALRIARPVIGWCCR